MSLERHLLKALSSRVATTAFLVLQSICAARLLGPEGRGLFAKLQASLNFFILFLGLGLTSSVTYFVANQKFEEAKIIGCGIVAWLIGLAFLTAYSTFTLGNATWDVVFPLGFQNNFYLHYFVISFVFNTLQVLLNATLSGRQKYVYCNNLDLINAVIRLVVFGAFLLLRSKSAFAPTLKFLFLADLVLSVVRSASYLVTHIAVFGTKVDFRIRTTLPVLLKFSLLMYLTYLINFFYLRIDYWFIEKNLGLAELGIYSVAANLAQFLTLIPMSINTIMLPYLSSSSKERAAESFQLFSSVNTLCLAISALALIVLARPLMSLLYGASFASGSQGLQVLAVSYFLLSVKHIFTYFNVSQGKIRINIEAEVLGLIVGLFLNFMLIKRFGSMGASFASLFANIFSCGYVLQRIVKYSRIEWPTLFFIGKKELWNLVRRDQGMLTSNPA